MPCLQNRQDRRIHSCLQAFVGMDKDRTIYNTCVLCSLTNNPQPLYSATCHQYNGPLHRQNHCQPHHQSHCSTHQKHSGSATSQPKAKPQHPISSTPPQPSPCISQPSKPAASPRPIAPTSPASHPTLSFFFAATPTTTPTKSSGSSSLPPSGASSQVSFSWLCFGVVVARVARRGGRGGSTMDGMGADVLYGVK